MTLDVKTIEYAAPQPLQRDVRRSRVIWFTLLLALSNLMWASQGVAVKYLQAYLGPIAMTFIPFYITTAMLFPLLLLKRHRHPGAVRPSWKDWKTFIWAGVAGQALSQLTSVWGVTKSTVSNASILNLLIPVMTAVMAPIMLRERVTRLQLLCLVVGLCGVLLMSVQDLKNASFINHDYLLGNTLLVLGCAGSAFYNVYCKGLMGKFGELDILIYSYLTASVASVPFLIWQEPHCLQQLTHFNGPAWLAFIFLSIFMYGVSMLLFFAVLKHVPVTVAAASFYLLPVFGVLLAVILVGERMSVFAAIGAAIVLATTIVIMKYDAKA